MKKIMGLLTMLCSLIGCTAQNEGFKSLSVEEYAKAIEGGVGVCKSTSQIQNSVQKGSVEH